MKQEEPKMNIRKPNTIDSSAGQLEMKGSSAASHVKISAILSAHPNKAEELTALLTGMAPHCRAEPGNLRWDLWRDQSQPDRYVIDELYVDSNAVSAHRETAHYKNYLARIGGLADRSALVLSPFEVEPSR
jgi:quinol monooxygenase YgiN